ncbi:MAG: hypothetical protein JSU70_01885 [Phycisphaerales bacterium]|nr:MAG: hypothetical protein JSU70_01885 [Phycisphaerales bacterium]
MPVGKRQQSNAMLYTLITFVGLFVVATSAAVIYYVKAEEYRTQGTELETQINDLADREEMRKLSTLIGAKTSKSRLGTMIEYLDKTTALVIGAPLDPNSAEVKVNNADREAKEALAMAQECIELETLDPNTTGLVSVVNKMKANLDNTKNELASCQKNLNDLQERFKAATAESFDKEKKLETEKEEYHQQVLDVTQKYEELRLLMEQTSDERAQALLAQLNEERAKLQNVNDELLKTQAELQMTNDRMKSTLDRLQESEPLPDREVAAYTPDGKVVLIDEPAQVVHLDIGTEDHVYQGLTFSVYDKGMPIPKDGKPKAEIEVFATAKTISAARITRSEIANPIGIGDLVANLVWDGAKANIFVVVGEFDLDGDGTTEYDAIDRIGTLIEKWGGTVANDVTAHTDFVVLGNQPQVLAKPTFEQLDLDPLANEKYAEAQERLQRYKDIERRAQALWIPVFKYERFLYFIGYKGQISKAGAF